VRCLLADGSATTRRILRNVLRDLGVTEIAEASRGDEALELAGEGFHLVIVGLSLPGLEGLDLVRRLRERSETATVPVLVIAARGTRSDVLRAREAGASGFVIRPFTPEALRPRLEALLSAAAMAGETGGAPAEALPPAV